MRRTTEEVLDMLRKLVKKKGSAKALAEEFKVSPQYLGDILHGRRDLGKRILDKMGLEARTYYYETKKDDETRTP